jgi:acetyl esterase/lipase
MMVRFNQKSINTIEIDYLHRQPESRLSKFMKLFIRITRWKSKLEKDMSTRSFNQHPAPLPKSLSSNFNIKEIELDERKVWQIEANEKKSTQKIVFLHGGAYVYNITPIHWQFVKVLLNQTNATIIVPDYPLAPSAQSKEVYKFMDSLYEDIRSKGQTENLIFLGDSAGAGLALGFAQHLRNNHRPMPQQLILLSPWLDITMTHPDIQKIDKKDPILGINGLRMAGEAYAGELQPQNSLLSPIYGEFHGLPQISVFAGTHDLLFTDSVRLRDKMRSASLSINYFEYPNMLHDWALIKYLDESKSAISQITHLIRSD